MKKRIFSGLTVLMLLISLSSCSGEKIKFDYFDGRFSPFFALHTADLSVTSMVHETLLVTSEEEAGREITDAYTKGLGIADIELDYNDSEKLVCNITIGEDVKFSDGTPVTADDVIFSMYVYADSDYEGWSGFNVSKLEGLKNYRYNNSLAENVSLTEEQLDKALAEPDEKLQTLLREKIVYPILEDELEWIERVYNDSAYNGTELGQYIGMYPKAKDLFSYLYSIDENYDSKTVETSAQVLEDIKAQYGYDYKTLADVVGVDLTSSARRCAEEIITTNILETMDGEPVNSISGIKKTGEKTLSVTINSHTDEQMFTVLGIFVAPLHYYGDESLFDIENESFGFVRGDLSAVRAKNETPVGAGRYILKEYKNGKTVSFVKNKDYFGNTDIPSKVVFVATGNSAESKTHGYYTTYDNYTYTKN